MIQRLCQRLFVVLLLALVSGCQQTKTPETIHLSGRTMGTTWSVTLLPGPDGTEAGALQQRLQDHLDRINRLMSTYDPASEVSRFNEQTGFDWVPVSTETAEVIELAREISALTDGAFDISVGPLVELWGFGATARGAKIPSDEQVSQAMARIGYRNLQVRLEPPALRKQIPTLRIDLSAIAKGYAVEALAAALRQQGIVNYLVEIDGEMQLAGRRGDGSPWRIAIEKPEEETREIATIFPLTDTALATSGNYRNFYEENGQRYAHTLDPFNGRPARNRLASVTVLDKTCARADALATALMVMGPDQGRQFCEQHGIAAYFLIHDRTSLATYASPAFEAFVKEVKP